MNLYNLIDTLSDDLPKLQYTLWCIKESLRLYSPVFNIFRRLTRNVELDSYLIPRGDKENSACKQFLSDARGYAILNSFFMYMHAGAWVVIDLLAIHWCSEIWDDPKVSIFVFYFLQNI